MTGFILVFTLSFYLVNSLGCFLFVLGSLTKVVITDLIYVDPVMEKRLVSSRTGLFRIY